MEENESIKALTRALDFEREGIKYYSLAAQKTAHPAASSIFGFLVEEEDKHKKFLCDLHSRLKAEDKWPSDVTISIEKDFRLIFKEEAPRIDTNVKISTNEIEALDFAINMENKGREMYRELSEKAADPHEKEFYAVLAKWEDGHARLVEEYFNFFQDHGMFTEE